VALLLTWQVSSSGVRRRPSLTATIATHLVTRSCCTLGAASTISLGMSAGSAATSIAAVRGLLGLSVSTRKVPGGPADRAHSGHDLGGQGRSLPTCGS
jgi:hypothetical protein